MEAKRSVAAAADRTVSPCMQHLAGLCPTVVTHCIGLMPHIGYPVMTPSCVTSEGLNRQLWEALGMVLTAGEGGGGGLLDNCYSLVYRVVTHIHTIRTWCAICNC